jgi:hypothetical protein
MKILERADDLFAASKVEHKTMEGIVSDLLVLSRVLSSREDTSREEVLTNGLGSYKTTHGCLLSVKGCRGEGPNKR